MGSGDTYFNSAISLSRGLSDDLCTNITKPPNQTLADDLVLHWMYTKQILIPFILCFSSYTHPWKRNKFSNKFPKHVI